MCVYNVLVISIFIIQSYSLSNLFVCFLCPINVKTVEIQTTWQIMTTFTSFENAPKLTIKSAKCFGNAEYEKNWRIEKQFSEKLKLLLKKGPKPSKFYYLTLCLNTK